MHRSWILCAAAAILCAGAARAQSDMGSDQERAEGKQLYDKYCSQCHGVNGDGQGYATHRVKPEPRDFTAGKYKFRTTPSGTLPTDADLARVIREGLPYTSMPGWPQFSEAQIKSLVYHLKTFSPDFQNPDRQGQPLSIPKPPEITAESVERGRAVYESQGCAACHGQLGRGDGPSALTLVDDWGKHIRPADMSQRWTFRGGPTREDMFRTFSTGLNGTPMPTYAESLEVEARWDLVNYMDSLGEGEDPNYTDLLVVVPALDEIDLSRGEELFAHAPKARFPLVGQIMQPGRNFYPSTTSIEVRGIYTRSEIAFVVNWHDMRAERTGTNDPTLVVPAWDEDNPKSAGAAGGDDDEGSLWGDAEVVEDPWGDAAVDEGDDFWGEDDGGSGAGTAAGEFSDAVALQFPSQLPSGIRRPYFIFGDAQNSVDLWFVDLARDAVQQYIGRGSTALTSNEADEFEVLTAFDQGRWTVIFKREMRSRSTISFEPGQFVPLSFSVWDGFNRERGNKRALSAWFHLYLEPQEQESPVGPMIKAALIALVVELLLVFYLRRRYAGGHAGADSVSGQAVPAGGMARQS